LWIGCHASLNRESFPDFLHEALRVARIQPSVEDKTAYFFAPYDQQLIRHAERIRDELDVALKEAAEETVREAQKEAGQIPLFLSGETSEAEHDTSIFDTKQYEANQVRLMEQIRARYGAQDPAEKLLQMFEDFGVVGTAIATATRPANEDEPTGNGPKRLTARQRMAKLDGQIKKALGQLMRAKIYEILGDVDQATKRELYARAYNRLNEIQGIAGVKDPDYTLEKRQERLKIIRGWADSSRDDFII
jgi:hypothetical protein